MLTPHEQKIFDSIKIPSENNPFSPEFPSQNPRFPATPTYRIVVPGFTNVRLKDESQNPTGTHKDRLAREIVVTYRNFLLAKKRGILTGSLPHMSIISSGSAAYAIQKILSYYTLPNLKVLMDYRIDKKYSHALEKIDAEIYLTDLSKKELSSREILTLTNNKHGFDITSGVGFDPSQRFYDWLSYEIINENPAYCFIPYGTGNLYENILNVAKKEVLKVEGTDPRFLGDKEQLPYCHYLGATTNNPTTSAQKLYSPHLPFANSTNQRLKFYKYSGSCGAQSAIAVVEEKFIKKALDILTGQGVSAEASGASGLGLLLQMSHHIPHDAKILIVNTGKTKLDTHNHT